MYRQYRYCEYICIIVFNDWIVKNCMYVLEWFCCDDVIFIFKKIVILQDGCCWIFYIVI